MQYVEVMVVFQLGNYDRKTAGWKNLGCICGWKKRMDI
jgi:hypothetical protein